MDIDGNVTEYYYGITGYTYRIIYPDNLQEWFFRDQAKNITTHIATDGTETSYTYDERGNVLSMVQADGSTFYYEYDEKDNLIGFVFLNLYCKTNRTFKVWFKWSFNYVWIKRE